MTDTYIAPTNGHEIRSTSNGGLRINKPGMGYVSGHEPQTLVSGRVASLREYFRDERDRELGRWRWPENPEYVVYGSSDSDDVWVHNEREAGAILSSSRNSGGDSEVDYYAAARAYFAAHPEKKPWHDAEQNDVWALQIKDCYEPELYRFARDTTCADSKVFRPVNNPARVFFEVNSPMIESAEKVWPQSKES